MASPDEIAVHPLRLPSDLDLVRGWMQESHRAHRLRMRAEQCPADRVLRQLGAGRVADLDGGGVLLAWSSTAQFAGGPA